MFHILLLFSILFQTFSRFADLFLVLLSFLSCSDIRRFADLFFVYLINCGDLLTFRFLFVPQTAVEVFQGNLLKLE